MKNNTPLLRSKNFSLKPIAFWSVGILILAVVASVLFIKFDTGAAATFTDQVLRPVLGDSSVIGLEKIYFNTSDKVSQLEYAVIPASVPFIASSSVPISTASVSKAPFSNLDLSSVHSSFGNLLAGEGQWRNVPLSLFPGQIILADTFMRPDPSRPYAFVTLVQMDMSKLRLWSVAGTQEPGGKVGRPGPGIIPKSIHDQGILVAAFDGGFQYRDGKYGMIVGKKTYLPLKNDLATLVGYNSGKLEIVKYEGQNLGSSVAFVRQNCPMLIENGVIGTQSDSNKKIWGRTVTSDSYTWRSGIGIDAKGNLIFAVVRCSSTLIRIGSGSIFSITTTTEHMITLP
jgi:hypothetical protein